MRNILREKDCQVIMYICESEYNNIKKIEFLT